MSRLLPSIGTGQFDKLVKASNVNWLFPTPRNTSINKGKKNMAKTDSFQVVVKNGMTKYVRNDKTGVYEYQDADSVYDTNNLADALTEFLTYVNDEYSEEKVILKFIPGKKK